eukprot:373706_1
MSQAQDMESMLYTWNITDPTVIQQIKTAKPGQLFKSPVFTMFNFRWILELYPNGHASEYIGEAQVFLELIGLSEKIKSVGIGRQYTLEELDACYHTNRVFTHENMSGGTWSTGTVTTQDLQKCIQFTFKVNADLHAVFDKDDNDITSSFSNDREDIKTDSHTSPHYILLKTAVDSIAIQVEKMSSTMSAMQQKMNDMELRLNEEQKSEDVDDKLNKMMNEIKLIKQTVNALSANNMNPKQKKVKSWLENQVALPQYFDIFMKNGIDELSLVALLDKATLKDIGIDVIGHQMKILNHVKQLLSQNVENEGTGDTAYM